MITRSLRFVPAILMAAAAVAFAPDISVDHDHNVDFARLHTYSWMGVRAGTSIWQDRITRAVDADLAAKGCMFQGGSKQLIWRGMASEVISSKPDKNDKKLNEATEKLFKHFPPPSKG